MSTNPGQPSEEELRAAYEAEIKKIRVEQIVLENIVTLVNLGMRRTGIAPGTEDERDPAQVHTAIEAIRALTPLLEKSLPEQLGPIRDALSQLQMAYVRIGGGTAPAGEGQPTAAASESDQAAPAGQGTTPTPEPEAPKPGEPGPAQRSGRLWIPGQ